MKTRKILYIIFISLAPIALLAYQDLISATLKINKTNYFEYLKSILPLVYSIIVLIINSMLSDNKDLRDIRKNELEKINKNVEKHNAICLNTKSMCNAKFRYLAQAVSIAEFFFSIPKLNSTYKKWLHKLQCNADGSNDVLIRGELRNILLNTVKTCCETGTNLNYFEYIANSKIHLLDSRQLSEPQEIFLTQFANDHITNTLDMNIIFAASEILSFGGASKFALEKYNVNIEIFKTALDKKISYKNFYDMSYDSCLNLLFLIECLCTDLSMLTKGLTLFSEKYHLEYSSLKESFPELDSALPQFKIDIPEELQIYIQHKATLRKCRLTE